MERPDEPKTKPTRASASAWLDEQMQAVGCLVGTPAARAFWAVFALSLLVALMHVVDALFIDSALLSFDDSWSVPSFASSLLFALGAWAAWRAAREQRTRDQTSTWTVVAVIMGLFAIEALVDIHHRVEGIGDLETLVLLSYPVLGLAALVVLLPRVLRLDPPAPLLLLGGGLLLIVSQALSAVNNAGDIGGAAGRGADVIEEVMEMLSPGLVIVAAVSVVGASASAVRARADSR